jgi:hypothetical protein
MEKQYAASIPGFHCNRRLDIELGRQRYRMLESGRQLPDTY